MGQDQEKKKGMSGLAKFGIGCGGLIVLIIIISIISSINGVKKTLDNTTPTGTQTNTKPSVKKFNIDEIYSQINTGMTEAQVEEIITQKAINCTESEMQGIGTSKFCTYGNVFLDSGSIMVSYMNGKVSTKTKSQY